MISPITMRPMPIVRPKPVDKILDSLKELNSVYKQNRMFKEDNFVEPKEIILENGKKTIYVPILETLKLLLGHEDILACILQNLSLIHI